MELGDILACPVCRGALDGARCTDCGRSYRIRDAVPDMTPIPPPDGEVRERWALWEALQANGERAYEIDPPSSLSVGEREDVLAFARFARLEGRVLDVGCGPQTLPSYAREMHGELVGIDPLLGAQPRGFAFVKGIAEYLPFRDGVFDRVLFATSIDHMLSAPLAVREAARVTRPGGAVVVWFGDVAPPPSLSERVGGALQLLRRGELATVARGVRVALLRRQPEDVVTVRTPRATMTFDVPAGAIDAFHFAHPDPPAIEGWLRSAGLTVDATERSLPGHCFVRALRPG